MRWKWNRVGSGGIRSRLAQPSKICPGLRRLARLNRRRAHTHRVTDSLYAFQNYGNTPAYADAHGAQGIASTCAMQLVNRSNGQARATRTQRVTQSDGDTIGV